MEWKPVPPLAIALAFFRSSAKWGRERLAKAAGTTKKRIGEWEAGHRTLSRSKAEALLALIGYSPEDLAEVLEQIERRRLQAQGGAGSADEEKLSRVATDLAAFFTRELAVRVRLHRAKEARAEAAALWKRLAKRTELERKALVEESAGLLDRTSAQLTEAFEILLAPAEPSANLDRDNAASAWERLRRQPKETHRALIEEAQSSRARTSPSGWAPKARRRKIRCAPSNGQASLAARGSWRALRSLP